MSLRQPIQSPPDQMLHRFVDGQPVSAVTIAFLRWWIQRLASQGITALLLLWNHASRHQSKQVRTWIRQHN